MNPTSYLDTLPPELQQKIVDQLDADSVASLALQLSALQMRQVALAKLQTMHGGLQALEDAVDREMERVAQGFY